LASRGYGYTGITDYSQSPKIPKGVPLKDLWKQIRFIDRLNQRLDLSENARAAATAGVLIAVSTNAHSTREFGLVSYGLDQARRAGLVRSHPDCLPWKNSLPSLKDDRMSRLGCLAPPHHLPGTARFRRGFARITGIDAALKRHHQVNHRRLARLLHGGNLLALLFLFDKPFDIFAGIYPRTGLA
jgi:hypothetical protein